MLFPFNQKTYYIMSKDLERFIQVEKEEHDVYSFTTDIKSALSLNNKHDIFNICDFCNNKKMNVKVVKIQTEYSLWNTDIERD